MLANGCGLRSAGVLLVSDNDGATWTRSTGLPLRSLDEENIVGGTPPDSLAVASPASALLVGFATTPPNSDVPSGPRKTDRMAGLLNAVGSDLAALCLGGPMAGYGPMEVVTSSNDGASWSQRCNNGPPGVLRTVGDCPGAGYPSAITAMPNGVLVMALGYPVGGVVVSLDKGRTWELALRSAATFLTRSQGTGAVWMLGLGPTSAGVRLAESVNGRTWHAVSLPR